MDDSEECECDEGAPAWMATFSDLATLLLTFFVLLLSFAELDVVHFKQMLGSVKEAFGVQFKSPGKIDAMATSPVELSQRQSSSLLALTEEESSAIASIKRLARQRGIEAEIDVVEHEAGVTVRLKDRLVFDPGSDMLKKEGTPILIAIAQVAKVFGEELSIEGHTDNRPINTTRFPSNWELSAARAASALRFMRERAELDPRKTRVVGFAETRPLDTNDTDVGRSKNRRVEFVLLKKEGEDINPEEQQKYYDDKKKALEGTTADGQEASVIENDETETPVNGTAVEGTAEESLVSGLEATNPEGIEPKPEATTMESSPSSPQASQKKGGAQTGLELDLDLEGL